MVKKAETKVLLPERSPPLPKDLSHRFSYTVLNSTMLSMLRNLNSRPPKSPQLSGKSRDILSEQWKKLSEKEKQKYVDEYTTNKEQYEKDKKAYEDKHGKIERKSKKNKKAAKKAAKKTKKGKEESEDEDEEDEEDDE